MTLCFVLGIFLFFFSSRRRHTRCSRDWSSDVCSSDLLLEAWQEAVSVPSIQQVLEENGLGEPTPRGVGGAGVQAELFAREPEPQLVLPLEGCAAQFREPVSTGSERSEEHTSELQSRLHLVCRLLLEKKKHN